MVLTRFAPIVLWCPYMPILIHKHSQNTSVYFSAIFSPKSPCDRFCGRPIILWRTVIVQIGFYTNKVSFFFDNSSKSYDRSALIYFVNNVKEYVFSCCCFKKLYTI